MKSDINYKKFNNYFLNQMPTIAQNQQFEDRSKFVAQRIQTCGYRFYKLIQTRRKQVPRLRQSTNNQEVQDEVRGKVLQSVDEYVNCLRSQHRGTDLPQYLSGSVNKFKEAAYTTLAPQFVLEDLRLEIANEIFNQNYKI